jgi:ubiquinone/menaquinone biosynthesis C-methylase UbiE
MSRSLSQEHFGRTAESYLTSKPHAQGRSLDRMVELAAPQPYWRALDIATGAGHTAYAFAPHVARVWATDITDEMLNVVRKEVAKRGLTNIRMAHAKAERLPFEDASFELVTSRIAPHHFDSIPEFVDEARRVLTPDGVFIVVDNVVPEGSVGDYVNAFERFRDPSHLRAWTMAEWRETLQVRRFRVVHEEELTKTMEFVGWAARHDPTMQRLLRSMLSELTPGVRAFLAPQGDGDDLTFTLREGLFVACPV